MPNRVKFGLKNCHYAKAVLDPATGEVTFGMPVAIPGAVHLAMDPDGETEPFFADDIIYYTTIADNGYKGQLELAILPDHFRKEILREREDSNGVIVEDSSVESEHFALLFEFSGDQKATRHCLYYCSAARPNIEGKTVGETKKVQTEKLLITAAPLPGGIVKVKTGDNTSDAVYNGWYTAVYQAESPVTAEKLASLVIGGRTLTPAFDGDITSYNLETDESSEVMSAAGMSGVTATILVDGAAHTSGQAAAWETGTNTVTVIAMKTGSTSTAYTVTVTHAG